MQQIKNYLWLIPFLSFLSGYAFFSHLYKINEIKTPNIVGVQLPQAIVELSNKNLNLRILAKKQDPDLPSGTILSQTPRGGQKIKPNQSVFIVTSEKPPKIPAPMLVNKNIETITKQLEHNNIRNKSYYLPGNQPVNSCIAQFPPPGTLLKWNNVITYVCQGNQKPVILPNFKNKTVTAVKEFLKHYHVKIDWMHTPECDADHTCDQHCIVTDQRPLAGSIITLDYEKPLTLHLQVQNIY